MSASRRKTPLLSTDRLRLLGHCRSSVSPAEALRGAAPAAVLPRGLRLHIPLAGGPELVRVVRVGRGWGSQIGEANRSEPHR